MTSLLYNVLMVALVSLFSIPVIVLIVYSCSYAYHYAKNNAILDSVHRHKSQPRKE